MQRIRGITFKRGLFLFAIILGLLFALTYPLPYFIEGPGSAEDVDPMIHITGQEKNEKGTYMLTTVSIRQATPLTYFMDYLPFYDRVSEKELFGPLENHKEYQTLQNYYMTSSIHSALQAGFSAAGAPSQLLYEGVYVMSVKTESDFYGKLKPGDIIRSVDEKAFESSQEFMKYVKNQQEGQTISIQFLRDKKSMEAKGKLITLKETKTSGIGITLVDSTNIKTDPQAQIKAGNIGGPSAGMMFALRIYTLLKDISLNSNYQIAGTGTIEPDGTVGRIGGIDKKVVAADRKGAVIFFAPDDEVTPEMKEAVPDVKSNYEEAAKAAKAIGTKMKIVPVKTLQDAIDYLERLP